MDINFKFVPKHYAPRTHEKMKEVLIDPNGIGPAIHYYMVRGGSNQKNITIWEPGTVSKEYIKTYGHYHIGNLDETYWIIFGTGVALLQKLAVDDNNQIIPDVVEEFKAIIVKQGDKIYMPKNYGHLLANTGKTYFVTADNSPVDFEDKDPSGLPGHADYKPVEKMRGFAYYVIDNNGIPTLKRNKLYKEIRRQDLGGLEVAE